LCSNCSICNLNKAENFYHFHKKPGIPEKSKKMASSSSGMVRNQIQVSIKIKTRDTMPVDPW